ncbi:MAG: sulfite exporter TauE/SafE family protein [Oscillospiraceae bacterium]|nr:sulfite exporter TauE/SafE family protein [Oscillospiraceae bacterium]
MNIFGQALAGFLTGVLASMGLGGGFILVVWLTLFMNTDQRTAQGINVLFFLPIAFTALIMHLKNGLINKNLVKKLLFGGVVGAAIGTLGAQLVANELLRKLFALFLIGFGLREMFSAKNAKHTESENPERSAE